ncbi:MAG: beta-ketoacyl synthase N-terminal-like domain-containing protein [Myxococcota bacterium]
MKAFVAPYAVRFDDTMAYGTHHFLTSFRVQCAGREGLLFGPELGGDPAVRSAIDSVHLLTVDAYSRNLGPAHLGQVLSIVVTVEDRGAATVRFCFRVVDEGGRPICCGFQTVACADPATGRVVPFPGALGERIAALSDLDEPAGERSFRDRVLAGGSGVPALFTPAVLQLARAGDLGVHGRIAAVAAAPMAAAPPAPDEVREAWILPGQGTFEPALLCARARTLSPAARDEAVAALRASGFDDVLVTGDPAAVRERGDDQAAIFLQGVWGARERLAAGHTPAVVLGLSVGELAAATVAGCVDLAGGLALVRSRLDALGPPDGGLLAVSAPRHEVQRRLPPPCAVAGRNGPAKTTVSGPVDALEALETTLRAEGIDCVRVRSTHAFHHPDRADAAARWLAALRTLPLQPPTIPLYSAIGRRLLAGDLAVALASALVRPFDLSGALGDLAAVGVERLVDCGTTGRIARLIGDVTLPVVLADGSAPGASTPTPAPARPRFEPQRPVVAVVGTGAVVPGAGSPAALHAHLVAGGCGIVDLAADPQWAADFAEPAGGPDKTRSGLAGMVRDADIVRPAAIAPAVWDGWARGQRLLAVAVAQALPVPSGRGWCLVGATADGADEHDLALALEAFAGDALDPAEARERLALIGAQAPAAAIAEVLGELVGQAEVTVLDAACASSLYAVALGTRALEAGLCDWVLAGGVFAPGPANACLFSQFDGLSRTECRPFDQGADGVVFGEGASVVLLERLADARARGSQVRALIRGVGLASDGRSPSANVPRQAGQELAMARAYRAYGLDPASVQVLEAHGTATPVGDATELRALSSFFARTAAQPLVVRSNKGRIGHTGWAAGTSSLVALCEAFAAGVVPGQGPYEAACDALAAAPGLSVSARTQPWPDRAGEPRRAAIDGFGFGGADAHVVIDAPSADASAGPACARVAELVAVRAASVGRDELDDVASLGVLPDIADDMDRTQAQALALAARLVPGLPAHEVALVVALEGKTERGVIATQRVLADHLSRRLGGAWAERIAAAVPALRPSGPYTLQGLMPNVAPGRAASRFDLRGPNLVVDAGADSVDRALVAASLLLGDAAKAVVVAALDGDEAAGLLVTTEALAAEPACRRSRSARSPAAAWPPCAPPRASRRRRRGTRPRWCPCRPRRPARPRAARWSWPPPTPSWSAACSRSACRRRS